MPHLTVEYSSNLHLNGDVNSLCKKLARCLLDQHTADGKAVYPIGGTRVRAYAADDYCIGDGSINDAAFVHAALKIAPGRSEQTRKETGNALLEVMKAHFAKLYEQHGLALSLEISEFNELGTWKHNNLHARFNAAPERK